MKLYWGFALAAVLALTPGIASAEIQLHISLVYESSNDGLGDSTVLPNVTVAGTDGVSALSQVNLTTGGTYVNHVFNVYATVTGLSADQNVTSLLFPSVATGGVTTTGGSSFTTNPLTIDPSSMGSPTSDAPSASWCTTGIDSGFNGSAYAFNVTMGTSTGGASGNTYGDYAASLALGQSTPFLLGTQVLTCNSSGGYSFTFLPNGGYFKVISGNTNGAAANAFAESYPVYSGVGDSALFAPRLSTSVNWVGGSTSTWAVGDGNNNWVQTASPSTTDNFYHGDTVNFTDGASSSTVTLAGNLQPASVVVNSSGNYVFTGSGSIIGAGTTLTKSGSGVLTLATANSYTGDTTITAGTLQVGNVAAIPSGTGKGNVVDNGALDLNGYSITVNNLSGAGTVIDNTANPATTLTVNNPTGASSVFSGAVTGAVALTEVGGGTLTLTGTNTSTSALTISAGTVQLGNGGAAGSVAGNIVDNAALVVNNTGSTTLGNLSGTGSFTKLGAGTVSVIGADTRTPGGVTVTGGVLQIGNGGTTGSLAGDIAIGTGTQLQFNHSDSITVANNLSGSGSVTKLGANTVTVTGTNTYTGVTTVKSGTLILSGSSAWNPVTTLGGADVLNDRTTLVFDYTGGATPASAVKAALTASYNNGWAAGASGGNIYSTTAAASGGTRTLGWKDNGTQVIVMDTLPGDSNLDGSTNSLDLNIVLAHYNTTGDTWSTGDLNYDGKTNSLDLNVVLARYNQSLPASVINDAGMNLDAAAVSALAAHGVSVVPEPGTLALLAAGLMGLLAYAWRKRK